MAGGEGGEDVNQDVGADADDDAADGWICLRAYIAAPQRQMGGGGADEVGGKDEQGLTNAVPGVEAAAASVKSELGVFVGKDLGLARPEGVSYLQTVSGVGGAEFAGLDEEGEESGKEEEQGDRMRGSEATHWSLWYLRRQALVLGPVSRYHFSGRLRACLNPCLNPSLYLRYR